ncbi:unnamed protein product [marine sediment metagenome]|uniref:Uncharacterized protein n=1 Tax=marine sediment metagenome TaxID=412755 RepID=X1KM83_9ZZZZ
MVPGAITVQVIIYVEKEQFTTGDVQEVLAITLLAPIVSL